MRTTYIHTYITYIKDVISFITQTIHSMQTCTHADINDMHTHHNS